MYFAFKEMKHNTYSSVHCAHGLSPKAYAVRQEGEDKLTLEKLDKHHLGQVIKATSTVIFCIDSRYP